MKSNHTIKVLGSLVMLVLASCAPSIKYYQVQNRLPQIKPGYGRLYIYQGEEANTIYKVPTIKLNGERVGAIPARYFAFVDKPAGHYEATADFNILISLVTRKNSVNFDLKQGQTRFIDVNVIPTYPPDVELRLIHPSQGLANLNNLTFNQISSDDLLP